MDELIIATVDRVQVNARCMPDEKNGSMKAGGRVSSTAAAHTVHTGRRAECTRGIADNAVVGPEKVSGLLDVQARESRWPA